MRATDTLLQPVLNLFVKLLDFLPLLNLISVVRCKTYYMHIFRCKWLSMSLKVAFRLRFRQMYRKGGT